MNSQPNGAGPAQSRESYKHSMEEWRQSALAQRNQYEPRVKEQVTRYFQEYSPPFYASVIGYRRDWNLLVATSRVSGFAATLGRDLEDVEAKAIAEYTLDNIHTNAGLKWLSVALAGYMTYRGRRTWQFPFYKPKLGGRFNPNEATSIFTNKKIRGAYPRATWHCLRFTAYSAVIMLMIEPAFRAVSFIRTEAAMTNDPRLKQFTKDAAERVKDVMSNPTISRAPFTGRDVHKSDENDPWASNDSSNTSPESRYQPTPTQSWDKTQSSTTTQQSQQPNDDWSVLDDDDDDASPIAASSRNKPVSSPAGSAWERIRQQSQGPTQQSDYQSRTWAAHSQTGSRQESQSGWGTRSAGSSSDSFSFSKSDEERAVAKEQAQDEFDRLVERERKGVDQEKAWGRK
ncbi:hypothetical protein NOF04DRAFT_20867 [Fusarium oxysporum II5]|uniref:Uncharacterized protein n=2 Tax=Fusarium oxysporum species complex TaxID=171631 RepID=X0K2T9_FUSO5|nr:uncharacterized protein FOIG_05901 [Fusarium odoratissimum NRRL 54006]EXM02951.1 hypothetical protein FOIG_05901 [Fusarium odoratissimum NRRL 54006]KAH7206746.1 hypothetical protein DER44DRAFT_777654 [Fusarium oxysporum]KAK2134971.1 hypothetical protein NOF04DRAFT_20867 [Fusarium oxysporum II5]TXC12224.1 hypothetical protein FocTR4_00007148 [Fusarium oxysporum f. sp. cubense]